jgi:hypothetical protein
MYVRRDCCGVVEAAILCAAEVYEKDTSKGNDGPAVSERSLV